LYFNVTNEWFHSSTQVLHLIDKSILVCPA
jgi:hypothetical protein